MNQKLEKVKQILRKGGGEVMKEEKQDSKHFHSKNKCLCSFPRGQEEEQSLSRGYFTESKSCSLV